MRTWSACLVLALMLAAAGPVWAQGTEPEKGEGSQAPIPSDGEELGSGNLGEDLELYWGGRRDLSPVSQPIFRKGGRIEATLYGGIIPNDPYLNYVPLGLRGTYHFTDSLGLEVGGQYTGVALDTDLKTFLEAESQILDPKTDFQSWRAGAVVVWSPLYGKLALLQRKLSHFDINLSAGAGVLGVTHPETSAESDSIKPEGILGLGFRFYATQNVSVRLDYRQYLFPKTDQGLGLPSEFTLGVSWFTGE